MRLSKLLALHQSVNVNSAGSVFTLVFLGTVNVAILFIAPVLIGAMVTMLHFTEAQAGFVVSAELAGMSLATFPALYWITRVNWRKALLLALLCMLAGNLVSALSSDYATLLAMRFLVGLAAGSSMSLCIAIIGMTDHPDRVFGLWVTGQLVFGAIGLFLLPSLFALLGYGFVYLLVAGLTAGLLLFIRHLPQQRHTGAEEDQLASASNRPQHVLFWAVLGLFSIFVFYIGQYGIWAFLERVGASIGLTPTAAGKALSLATMVGIGGALGAAVLDIRFGRIIPITTGTAVSVFSMYLLWGDFGPNQYLMAACIFSFTFNFILPYLMACIAHVDITGRLVILCNISSGGGLAAGPALAAVLQEQSGFDTVVECGIALTLLSLLLIARLALYKALPENNPGRPPSEGPLAFSAPLKDRGS